MHATDIQVSSLTNRLRGADTQIQAMAPRADLTDTHLVTTADETYCLR